MARLDAERIRRSLAVTAESRLADFEVFDEINSTSTYLKNRAAPAGGRIHVAVAGHQTAGRGRGDRQWLSAPGESLCLSMSYSFERPPVLLPAVTLALGVGIARRLADIGVEDLRLKWPNDLLIDGGKLGGILSETRVRDGGDMSVVAGVGINVGRPEAFAEGVRSGWARAPTGLAAALPEPPSREALAAMLINAMLGTFMRYEEDGFGPFRSDFESLDWLDGKRVVVDGPDGRIKGVAKGIDARGALLVDTDEALLTILSGTILVAGGREAA